MIVIPCSAGTLGAIANGISRDLLQRAADVTLEGAPAARPRFRESPYSLVHIENMRRAALAGAIIAPPSPAFYIAEPSVERFLDAYCLRIARLLGLEVSGEDYPMEGPFAEAEREDGRIPAPAVSLPALSRSLKTTLEMIKFSHTLFALPFALLAAVLAARGLPSWPTLAKILLAMVGARSAAMAHNRLTDRAIDAANPRTASRALPSGAISADFVRVFLAGFGRSLPARRREPEPPDPRSSRPSALALLLSLCLHETLHLALAPRPRPVPGARAHRRLDRRARKFRVDSDPPRPRGSALDGRLRHPLRPSGRGARPSRRVEISAGALGHEDRARRLGPAATRP